MQELKGNAIDAGQPTQDSDILKKTRACLDVNLVDGSGQLVVFSNGTRREGTWSKTGPRVSSKWLDDQGAPLVIPPGQVWVEILPQDSPLARSALI